MPKPLSPPYSPNGTLCLLIHTYQLLATIPPLTRKSFVVPDISGPPRACMIWAGESSGGTVATVVIVAMLSYSRNEDSKY